MSTKVRMAFNPKGVTIPLERILPARRLPSHIESTAKYKRIAASIEQLGVIEPLVVFPQSAQKSTDYLLLDGHVRLHVLKKQGAIEAFCLLSTDDEALTYNHKVNQVQAIQEHFMIVKAIESGVSEERIAATLNVDVGRIKAKRDLLEGICPEAVELLREKNISAKAVQEVKKVKPMRQIEMAELMIAGNNYTAVYARSLVIGSKPEDRLEARPDNAGISPEDVARMERELESLSRDFRKAEEIHGRSVLNLVLATGYLRKLLEKAAVVRFLSQSHPDLLAEFQKIIEVASLEQPEEQIR